MVKLSGRKRIIRCYRPDLLVFQQCRHSLNDGDLRYGVPYVLDTDDADFYLTIPDLPERLERTSRHAAGIMAGSRFLRDWHSQRNPNTTVIWTGTRVSSVPQPRHPDRQSGNLPILAWAQAKPLDYHEELDLVLRLVAELQKRRTSFTLRLYGVAGPQDAERLKQRVPQAVRLELIPPMTYDDFLASLRDVAVGLSPIISASPFSRGKSFGKILGYLDARVPVIASDEGDHALFFDGRNGVVSNNLDEWAETASRWLRDPEERQQVSDAAFVDFQRRLSLDAAAARTDTFLRSIIGRPPSVPHYGLGPGLFPA